MKKARDNSCLRGCTIYLLVLVVILLASMAGVSKLGSMLGSGNQASQIDITTLSLPQQPATASEQNAEANKQPVPLLPTIAVAAEQIQQAAQAIEAGKNLLPTIHAQIPPQIVSQIQTQIPVQMPTQAPQTQPQAQPKSDGISGQATAPFYIVQSGDTLWMIASKFGTTVDALKAANQLGDNIIKPGQLLYLPQP